MVSEIHRFFKSIQKQPNVGPQDIMLFPKTTKAKRQGKTAIITSSPYQLELESSQNNLQKIRKALVFDDCPKSKKRKTSKKTIVKTSIKNKINDSSSEDDDADCLYCFHLFSQSSRGWVQCSICHLWAHCACAGIDDDDDEAIFVCEKCSQ